MASLTLETAPGFTELPDSTFNTGAAVTDSNMKALNAAAKFGVVRNEQFWGFYRNGEVVGLPVSPADGYEYARNELLYMWSVYSTGSAPSSCNGTQTPPTRGATGGQGTLLMFVANVDQATGAVECGASYWNGNQSNVGDGILLVMVHAQRSR